MKNVTKRFALAVALLFFLPPTSSSQEALYYQVFWGEIRSEGGPSPQNNDRVYVYDVTEPAKGFWYTRAQEDVSGSLRYDSLVVILPESAKPTINEQGEKTKDGHTLKFRYRTREKHWYEANDGFGYSLEVEFDGYPDPFSAVFAGSKYPTNVYIGDKIGEEPPENGGNGGDDAPPPDTTRPGTFSKWDVNRDGKVTPIDAALIHRGMGGTGFGIPIDADLDVNGDGTIDTKDIIEVLRHID